MKNISSKKVIIISGPTAVGKTSMAIDLAKHYHTEIISADSRQCFKELSIGVARPSARELELVNHHFIATHSIQDEVTAASFEKYALQKTNELFNNHDVVVMVGGTGLYIKAFCEGLDVIPDIDTAVRQEIIRNYEEKRLEWLQQEVKENDPEFYATGEIKNPQRLIRALEVMKSTGQSVLSFRKGIHVERDFELVKIGLDLPKEQLLQRINERVDEMLETGLLEEVNSLNAYRNLNALQTVGYTELFDYFDNKCSLEKAVELIKIHTRQYAKRQLTWFKKDPAIKWFAPGQLQEMIEYSTSV